MRIAELRWTRYRLPFVASFTTAHGVTRQREGLILRLTTSDGATGLGEAAPLAEFGGGDVNQTESIVRALAPELPGIELNSLTGLLDAQLGQCSEAAALRCGLETAMLDLQARYQGIRLAELLSERPPAVSVRVNATIGVPELERAVAAATDAVERGFRTVKLKVGMNSSIADEVRRVAAVRDAIGPEIALRLDANAAWDMETAIAALRQFATYDIECVEQPVAAYDIDALARVRRASPIVVAADEAVTSVAAARQIIQRQAADILIIKPMVCGGLVASRTIIEEAVAAGLRVVVTSTIESGVGVAAALHLAATLPVGSPACGLATASLLAHDLLAEPLSVINGAMLLPRGPGLGIELGEEMLRYSRA